MQKCEYAKDTIKWKNNGGGWKMANSIENLGKKTTRMVPMMLI